LSLQVPTHRERANLGELEHGLHGDVLSSEDALLVCVEKLFGVTLLQVFWFKA